MKTTTWVAAATMLASVAFGATGKDLAANGGFETADDTGMPAGWLTDAAGLDAEFARDTTVKRSGDVSAKLTVAPTDKLAWPSFAAKVTAVEAGAYYKAEAYIRTLDVTRGAYISIDFFNEKGERISCTGSSLIPGTTKDWTKATAKGLLPAGATWFALKLIVHGAGTAWFDDVTIGRDEEAEKMASETQKPVPAEFLAHGVVDEGDLAPLQQALAKARKGSTFTIGIIGGSITQGASASSKAMHYSAYVMNWWKAHFPDAKFELVNAGIGATGSNYGALRIERDLLSKNPDFVIVEYAVNDGPTQELAESYEGVLRQILARPAPPALMLIFMMNQAGGNAQEWQAKLGKHYALPMVSYRDLLWPEIEAKRMTWQQISPDAVHPNDLGHAYAGKLLCCMLDRAAAKQAEGAAPATPKVVPAPMLTDCFQFTSLFEADALKPVANQGWELDTAQGWNKCWKSAAPGSVIEFEITGERLFLSFWKIRGAMGKASVIVDGGPPTVFDAWFDQTWGGYRQMMMLLRDQPGTHRVRVELLADKHPESTGNEFRILCMGAAGVRK